MKVAEECTFCKTITSPTANGLTRNVYAQQDDDEALDFFQAQIEFCERKIEDAQGKTTLIEPTKDMLRIAKTSWAETLRRMEQNKGDELINDGLPAILTSHFRSRFVTTESRIDALQKAELGILEQAREQEGVYRGELTIEQLEDRCRQFNDLSIKVKALSANLSMDSDWEKKACSAEKNLQALWAGAVELKNAK